MTIATPLEGFEKPRLKALLKHFAAIEDPREPWRVAHPLPEVLLLVVCGTICDCDDYDGNAKWREAHLDFLRRYLPYHHCVPGGLVDDPSDEPRRPGPCLAGLDLSIKIPALRRTDGGRIDRACPPKNDSFVGIGSIPLIKSRSCGLLIQGTGDNTSCCGCRAS